MAGCSPTRLVKSHFVITSPMSLKRTHFLSHLLAIIPSSSECPGSNASIPRSTGHPKRSNLLYFPHTTNLQHHPTNLQSPFPNLYLPQLPNLRDPPNPRDIQSREGLNHDEPPNRLQSQNRPQSSNRLQSPTHHNHQILLMNLNPCLSRMSHAPGAVLKTPSLHPRSPKANCGRRNLAYQYHANQFHIVGPIRDP